MGILARSWRQLLDKADMAYNHPHMARISESHKRFRSKPVILKDLAFVLNADLSYGTKFAVLAEVAWVWSEYDGKYNGCRYWSNKALRGAENIKNLIHEHAVPKKIIFHQVFETQPATPAKLKKILDIFCVGCVVTREEDSRLNRAGLRS